MEKITLDLLTELIRSYPVSGKTEVLNANAEKLKTVLEKAGLFCKLEEIGAYRLLYAATGETKTPDYLFNAHMDVVPAIHPEQTTPVIRDGVMYARGCHDCLGSVVCIAELLKRCRTKASVGAFFTMDEETGGSTTGAMVERGYVPRKSTVIIDSGFGAIAYAQKGILSLKLKAVGRGGHSSAPWAFDNPIDKLIDGYLKLREAWKNPTGLDRWHDSFAPTILTAGTVVNQIPDSAEMIVNVRYVVPEGKQTIPEKVRRLTGLEVEVLAAHQSEPVVLPDNDPELLRMQQCCKAVLKKEIPLYRMDGATDARHFASAGKPILIMGLGGGDAHSANEHLILDSIDQSLEIFENYVTGK